ncbi:MAG: penicillin-binding protein 2, partial [bacterium]|nr:penicillin-binding protein 2 [bacterium]
MFWKRRSHSSRVFHVQEDGRYGCVSHDGSDQVMDELFSTHGQGGHKRVALVCTLSPARVRLVSILFVASFLLFFARSAQLQIIQGDHYARLSDRNRERVELLVPSRGLILDRNGEPLAWNEPAFLLTMTISSLPDDEVQRTALFDHVGDLAGLQRTDFDLLLSQYADRRYDAIPVLDEVNYESALRLAIEVSTLPGFDLTTHSKRVYVSGVDSLSHVLGYTGTISARDLETYADHQYRLIDDLGKTGVESEVESLLRGVPGHLTYEVDALGDELLIVSKEEPVMAADVTLSIDADFQKFIEIEMKETFERVNASRGSVIAIDPSTGAIRALVSLPGYDANEFVGGISQERYSTLVEDEDQPLFPRAISGEFPSGSTFKPFIAYAALAEGVVGEHTSFVSSGGLRIGQWFFPDWRGGGHGVTDVRKAIYDSVNTYFYIVGGGYDNVTGLGVARIKDYAERFGFGALTGIDLPGEADGFLPTREWKKETKGERWYVGDTYHLAIGQGDFLTTPLQMAVATAAIANEGEIVTPHVVASASGFGETLVEHPSNETVEQLDPFLLEIVRSGMRQTVTLGSARSLSALEEATAAKTGTAQTIGDRPYHSWFTGFGP